MPGSPLTPAWKLEGYDVDDHRADWWGYGDRDQVYWSPKPWTHPGKDAAEATGGYACEEAIEAAGGTAYEGRIERTVVLPEGIALLVDPEVFTGPAWLLLDPARQVKP